MGKVKTVRAMLGIDAAWTSTEPSGVALIAERRGSWRLIAAEPSSVFKFGRKLVSGHSFARGVHHLTC